MVRVLYPGSFNPITKGHMNIINEASNLFDEVIVAIMYNPNKTSTLFTINERYEMISELYKDYDNVKVVVSDKATVDVALENDCKIIVRGIRNFTDYDYEAQMQQVNREISNNQVYTICLFADRDYQFISSSMVRELFGLNKDISKYVDEMVEEKMKVKKLGGK